MPKKRGGNTVEDSWNNLFAAILYRALLDAQTDGYEGRDARFFLCTGMCSDLCDMLSIDPDDYRRIAMERYKEARECRKRT